MTPLTNVDQSSASLTTGGREDLPRQRVNRLSVSANPGSQVDFTAVKRAKDPTRLGRYVLSRMADVGMVKQVDLVRATGGAISESTVSRIILDADYLPRRDTLIALARALRVDPKALVLYVFELDGPPVPAEPLHPRAAHVNRVLGPTSRLTDDDRTFLDTMIGRLIDPVEKSAGRRRAG